MKKRLFGILLSIAVMVTIMVFGATSANAATYGDLTYTVSNGEVTITDCNTSKSGELIIPSSIQGVPVTNIGEDAFLGCRYTSIEVPDSVVDIGMGAFSRSVFLENIKLSENITCIKISTFSGCAALTNIEIPSSVKTIERGAFFNCASLTEFFIPANVTEIQAEAISGCRSLKGFKVASDSTSFSAKDGVLFNKNCTELVSYPAGKIEQVYVIPTGVTVVRDKAFYDNKQLVTIVVTSGVETIGSYNFQDCSILKSAWISKSVTEMSFGVFFGCSRFTDVYYEGSQAEWDSISIGGDTEALFRANLHCDVPAEKVPGLNGWIQENEEWYYIEIGEKVKNAWRKDSTGWCFLDEEGRWVLDSFVKDSTNKWAYITKDGYYYETTGWVEYEGNWYYLEKGYRVENDWRKDSTGWCFLDEEGRWVLNTFVKDSTGMWAYITKDGYYYETTGWIQYDGGWYYLEKGYAVTSQWRKDSVGWCYLSESGRMVTNSFVPDSMGLCWIGGEGYMLEVTDWQLYNDQWYYLQKGYAVTNDWRLDSKGWCYLGEDGAMLTSTWFKDSVGWCYIDENGYCLANGTYEVDGHEYTFDADGRIEGEPIQE